MDPEKKADTKMLRAKDGMNENDLDIEFDKGSKYSRKCKMVTAILIASFIVAIIIIVVLVLVLRTKKDDKITTVVPATESIPPLPTGAPAGPDGPYASGVVAADAGLCSELGRDILRKNGSAVDCAIATLFCIGIINMHSAGVGGGGFMTVYIRSLNKVQIFDHREVAPKLANSTMYINSSLSSRYGR